MPPEGENCCPSQMARNSDGLKASAHSLKHWESCVKWLQEALNTGYKMNIRKASWMCLKSLEDFREKLGHCGRWKPKQKKA